MGAKKHRLAPFRAQSHLPQRLFRATLLHSPPLSTTSAQFLTSRPTSCPVGELAGSGFGSKEPANGRTMEIQTTAWKKFGHDRTYLADDQGNRLGWVDNKTGELTVESTEHQEILQEWMHRNYPTDGLAGEEAWTDYATNVPGQGVRTQANQSFEEMRERSRFWTGVARVLDLKTEERAWRKGAEGEESVGTKLDRLIEDGWFVLHSIPVGNKGSDIDHVVIGHGGVYTLNTKNHPGKKIWVSPNQIRVDGFVHPYLRNSRHEAERACRLLSQAVGWSVPVRPALVLLTGTIIPNVVIKKRPVDVDIFDRMDVPKAFHRAPQRLTPDQVREVFEVARRSTTWIQ